MSSKLTLEGALRGNPGKTKHRKDPQVSNSKPSSRHVEVRKAKHPEPPCTLSPPALFYRQNISLANPNTRPVEQWPSFKWASSGGPPSRRATDRPAHPPPPPGLKWHHSARGNAVAFQNKAPRWVPRLSWWSIKVGGGSRLGDGEEKWWRI